jgi:hypothetical protein
VHCGGTGLTELNVKCIFAGDAESCFIENENELVILAYCFVCYGFNSCIKAAVNTCNVSCAILNLNVYESSTLGVILIGFDPYAELSIVCYDCSVIYNNGNSNGFLSIVNEIPEIGSGLICPSFAELLDSTNINAVYISVSILVGFVIFNNGSNG